MSEKTSKVTKAMVLTGVKFAAENGADFGEVSADDVIAYVDTTLAQLAAKAAKAKEKAAEKKAVGDALRDKIESMLTDELQTIDAFVKAIDDEEVTKAKVAYRLAALVKQGKASKGKVDKINGYALPGVADAE